MRNSMTVIVIMPVTERQMFILIVNVIVQSDFAVKVKVQIDLGRQMDKRTAADRDTEYFH